jgi:HemY protein
MAQAQLQIIACQHELALATLSQLRIQDPKHGRLLGLLAQVYRELRDWDSLVRLIPELRKRHALPDAGIDGMEIEARRQLLMLPLPPGATGILRQAWGSVPGHLQRQPDLVAAYARQLIDLGQMAECETLLAGAIEHSWNDALVHLYGLVEGPDGSAQMQTAEGWMTHQNDNPMLLLTLGRLALRNKAPGKARDYLEKSILLHGPLEAYQELGRLLEQAGEHDKALELCQRALGLYAQEARMVARRSAAGQSPHQRSNPATAHYGY